VAGMETLGCRQVDADPSSPWANQFPTPPVMGAQLECIIYTKFLRPWSAEVRSLLEKIIRGRSRMNWLSVYLTLFVLLHSCSLLIHRDYEYARQIGLWEEYANPQSVKDHQRGVTTLLAHFHVVLGGALPFRLTSESRPSTSKRKPDFTPKEEKFVKRTYAYVSSMSKFICFQHIQVSRLSPTDSSTFHDRTFL